MPMLDATSPRHQLAVLLGGVLVVSVLLHVDHASASTEPAAVTAGTAVGVAAPVATAVATPTIVPFRDWAPAWCPTPSGGNPLPVERLVVHHTHDPVATSTDQLSWALGEVCDGHLERGFDTIGYHYVVDPWGTIYQARGGMPTATGAAPAVQAEGAHVAGSNPGAVGVVFLGDHEAAPPTAAALDAAQGLLAWLLDGTGLDPLSRVAVESTGGGTALVAGTIEPHTIAGHRDTNHTLCPGEHLAALLTPLRQHVTQVLAGEPTAPWADLVTAPPAPAAMAATAPANSPRGGRGVGTARSGPAAEQSATQAPPRAPGTVAPQPPRRADAATTAPERTARDLRAVGLGGLALLVQSPLHP